MKNSIILLGLVFFVASGFSQPTEEGFILRSSDGREAVFTGILAISDGGIYASRFGNPKPILVRWDQLDMNHFRSELTDVSESRALSREMGMPVIFPVGTYGEQEQNGDPEASLYLELHTPIFVKYPKFDLFFSRKDPRIFKLWDSDYDRYNAEKRRSVEQMQRMLQSLFPDYQVSVDSYGFITSNTSEPALSPARTLMIISDRNYKSSAMALQYLRHIRFFDQLKSEMDRVALKSGPPLSTRIEEFSKSLQSINTPTAVNQDALRTIRRFTESRLLP